MIRRILCFLFNHDWRYERNLLFDTRVMTLHLCHRCGKVDWK